MHVATVLTRPNNAIPQLGAIPPYMPHPRPYTLPFGQVEPSAVLAESTIPFTIVGALGSGVLGAGVGAFVSRRNRGRNAVIGATVGALVGGFSTFLILKSMRNIAAAQGF